MWVYNYRVTFCRYVNHYHLIINLASIDNMCAIIISLWKRYI